nr:hypothetical protein [uncultured Cellulosilyticum sp.]
MLSGDELWEWASNTAKRYSVGIFYTLNQFELQAALTDNHEMAMQNVERSFEDERKKKDTKEEN